MLRCFSEAGLRYVVVEGLAVNAHGVIRATKDIDVCPDPERENLVRLAALLRDLEAVQVGAVLVADALVVELAGLRIPVCSLAHLRAMQRAAGRPRDLQDLAVAHGDVPA